MSKQEEGEEASDDEVDDSVDECGKGGSPLCSLDRLAIMARAAKLNRIQVTVLVETFSTYGSTEAQTVCCTVPGKIDDEHGVHACRLAKCLAHRVPASFNTDETSPTEEGKRKREGSTSAEDAQARHKRG